MTKYLLIALAILSALLAGSGILLKRSYAEAGKVRAELSATQDALEGAQEAAKLNAKVSVARSKARASTARKSQVDRQALEKSLRSNNTWADQPVPADVQEALRAAINERQANVPPEQKNPPPGPPGEPVSPSVPVGLRPGSKGPGE